MVLTDGYSPEQRAGRLQRAYPDDMRTHLSAETIDVGLYVLPRGTLRSELLAALRQARTARRPRSRGTDRRGQLLNMTPIADRPAEVVRRTMEHGESPASMESVAPGLAEGRIEAGRGEIAGGVHGSGPAQ